MSSRKGVLLLALAVMAMLLWSQPADAAWYGNLWTYRKPITIDHTKVPNSVQSSFPVLISLSADAGLVAHARSDGFDILFTSNDGVTKIPYQREQYASGTLVAWVQVPAVSNLGDTVVYMYYGNAGAIDQQNPTGVWDANYKAVWHLDETGTGASGEYKDATSTADTGTLTGTSVLKAGYNMIASANSFFYEGFPSVASYTVVAGDTVEYDVYWTSATDFIGFDFTTSTNDALRNYPSPDQNGLSAHPGTDLSARALNKWYHRKIPIPAPLVGQLINRYDIACEFDGTATKTGYIANLRITNGGGIVMPIYSSGDAFTHSTHIFNPAGETLNAFANAPDPASTTATGEVATALNSDGARYVSMASSPTSVVNNWTLEAWINPAILSQHGFVVYNGNDAGGYGFGMGNAAGDLGNKLTGLYGFVTYIDSGYTFASAGAWYHIVMVRSAGTVSFYVNGVQTALTSTSTPNTPTAHLTIGNELDSSNRPYRYFNGIIDDVRISIAARSADWIKTEYNNQSAPGTFYTVGGEQPRPRIQIL